MAEEGRRAEASATRRGGPRERPVASWSCASSAGDRQAHHHRAGARRRYIARQAFPSSITETLSYDAAKRPTSISLGSAGSISQAFDRAGNVTSDGRTLTGISGDAGANSQSFNYDGLGRLTSSSLSAATRSYTYDLDGNRLSKAEGGTTTTYAYDRTDQLIKQTIAGVDKVTSFDKFGNLTSAADNANAYTSYAFDEANRLTTITPPTGSAATFTIDPLDRHAQRTVGAATDTYGYVGPTETAFETGASGTRSLLDLDGSRLAVKNGSTVAWVLFDLHGSIVALCPAGGSILSDAYRYDGWGQTIATAGSSANPWKYRGLLTISPGTSDALYDMVARDYAPSRGTFTQLDSVQGSAANPLTMNRFLYALANPATLIDPDGHRPENDEDIALWQENQQRARSGGGGGGGGSPGNESGETTVTVHFVENKPVLPDGTFADPADFQWVTPYCIDTWPDDSGGGLCEVWWNTRLAMDDAATRGDPVSSVFLADAALGTLYAALTQAADQRIDLANTDLRIAYTLLSRAWNGDATISGAGAAVYAAEWQWRSGRLLEFAGRGVLFVSLGLSLAESVEAQLERDAGRGYGIPVEVARVGVRYGFDLTGAGIGGGAAALIALTACEGASAGFATWACVALFTGAGAAIGSEYGDIAADAYFDWIDAEPRVVFP